MNLKQSQLILSDLLMKCEEENVNLPKDPFDTVEAALHALQAEISHEMSRGHLQAALTRLKKQCGVLQKKKIKRSPGKLEEQESSVKKRKGRSNTAETKSPTGKRASRIMQEIQSSPAKNPANQKLVDQLAELGDYESKTGHIQRGTSRMRAAKQLKEAKEEIKSGEQARKLDRIGPSAAAKIEEILHHGLKGAIEEYQQEKTEESQHKSPQELASPPPHHTDEEDRPPEEEDVEERSAEEEARREEAMENKHELEDAIADEEEEQQEREEEEANLDV